MLALMLASNELDAAVLGAHWVASRGEPDLAKAALNFLAKIEVVVPERLRGYVLEPATSIAPVVPAFEVVNSSFLRNTIRAHRNITLVYKGVLERARSAWSGQFSLAIATRAAF